MVVRRPLVLIAGQVRELPNEDSLPASGGGGGGGDLGDLSVSGSSLVAADSLGLVSSSPTGDVTIYTDDDGAGKSWKFEAEGTFQFPDQSVQTTAFSVKEVEITFPSPARRHHKFTISDTHVSPSSKIVVTPSGNAAAGRAADENEMDLISYRAAAGDGEFTVYATCLTGLVVGAYKINYVLG